MPIKLHIFTIISKSFGVKVIPKRVIEGLDLKFKNSNVDKNIDNVNKMTINRFGRFI